MKNIYKDELCLTEDEYLIKVRLLRKQIELGGEQNLCEAAQGLKQLEVYRPWRMEYVCARIALMIAKDEDCLLCEEALGMIDQEYMPHKELVDVFRLKRRVYEAGSLPEAQCAYSEALYAGKSTSIYFSLLSTHRETFLHQDYIDEKVVKLLAEQYYIVRNMDMYYILMLLWCRLKGVEAIYEKYMEFDAGEVPVGETRSCNIAYLAKVVYDSRCQTVLLIDDLVQHILDLDVLQKIFCFLGHQVILLKNAIHLEKDNENNDSLLEKSMESATILSDNTIVISPYYWSKKEGGIFDNRAELAVFMGKSLPGDGVMLFFTTDEIMNQLHKNKLVAKDMQRMSEYLPEQFEKNMSFGWSGDYLNYISYMYDFSVKEKLDEAADCEFSIVIPVRNSADTLRYTLQTCLEQRFLGKYEIVLSDNSDEGNLDVYNLYCELGDPHIQYYKTPAILELGKSFEFAFLQARGDFIFSIGADDGIFPWTLEVLHKLLQNMGDAEVLLWQRGLYAWPGFNRGQQNQLTIPVWAKDFGEELSVFPLHKIVSQSINDLSKFIYNIPLLYINSGFKRTYFKTLLARTGRLWDGPNQDVYMGLVASFIGKKVMMTEYPLTLAGLSMHSLGGVTKANSTTFEQMIKKNFAMGGAVSNYLGQYVWRASEYMVPCIVGQESVSMFWVILRLHELNVVPDEIIKRIDWAKLYTTLINSIDVMDILFERRWGQIKYGVQFSQLQAYRDSIAKVYTLKCRPVIGKERKISKERCYRTGFSKDKKMLTLDGKDFSVENVYEAVAVVAKILGL